MTRAEWMVPGMGLLLVAAPIAAAPPSSKPAPNAAQRATADVMRSRAAAAEAQAVSGSTSSADAPWQTFTNAKGGYSVMMPGRPWKWGRRPGGEPLDSREERYTANAAPYLYSVSSRMALKPFSGPERKVTLDLMAAVLEKAWHGKVLSAHELSKPGYLGREFHLTHRDREMVFRAFVGTDRMLTASVDGPEGRIETPDASRFLGSFQILAAAQKQSADRSPFGQPATVVKTPAAPKKAGSALPGWRDYLDRDGAFRVHVPAKIISTTRNVNEAGLNLSLHVYVASAPPTGYQFGYVDYPDAVVKQVGAATLLKGFRTGFLQARKAKAARDRVVKQGDISWQELTTALDSHGSVTICRYGLSGSRLFHLCASSPGDPLKTKGTDQFFASFQQQQPATASSASNGTGVVNVTSPGTGAAPGASGQPVATTPAVTVKPVVWKKHDSPDRAYTVRLPGQPAASKGRIKTSLGPTWLKGFTAQSDGERYEVGQIDAATLSSTDAQLQLDSVRDGYITTLDGRVTDTRPILASGTSGIEFRAELRDGRAVQARLLSVGSRLVLISAITPMDQSYSKSSAKFLNSLHVKP